MTDRIKGFTVILDKDYRDDDASEIMIALQNIRGVTKVSPLIVSPEDHMARERIKREIIDKIWKLLQ